MSPRFGLILRNIIGQQQSRFLTATPKMSVKGAYHCVGIIYSQKFLTLFAGSLVVMLLIKTIHHEHYIRDVTKNLEYARQIYGVKNWEEDKFSRLMLKFPEARVRFDNKRMVQIYDHVRIGQDWNNLREEYDICLSTQTSIERMYWVTQVVEHWTAPLSLAVFLVDQTEWWIFNMFSNYLERCYPAYKSLVSVHIVLPDNATTHAFSSPWEEEEKVAKLLKESMEKSCGTFAETKDYLQNLLVEFEIPAVWEKDKLATKIVYPQNHLRNVARKTCPTAWTYSVDVDIIPRDGLADMLQQFISSLTEPCEKCAYVVPTFELEDIYPFPRSKMEISHRFKNKTAKQVNADFQRSQEATNYTRWTSTYLDENMTQVSHHIAVNKTLYYEPYYISTDDIPAFDERFLGYGLTRSSQFWESKLAGWNFTVLTPVFAIHWGLHKSSFENGKLNKEKASLAEKVREQQTSHNRGVFLKIVKEMELKRKTGMY